MNLQRQIFNLKAWAITFVLAVTAVVQFGGLAPAYAFDIFGAGGGQSVCKSNPGATVCEAQKGGGILGKGGVLATLLSVFIYFVAVISVFMMVIGGLRYVLSGGDPSGTKSGKNTIIYGLAGLVIAVFGAAIIQFVLGYL
ncbi:MAG TPA: hypothetical protein VGS28_01735 [Candidatus Saccharimonadales bacterium]|nr:hypothetical protein [Candidatus Saccharimonadales bacterium]